MYTKINMEKLTCLHLFPRNSLFTRAFCPYIIGDDQNPHSHHFFTLSIGMKQRQISSSVIVMKKKLLLY